MFTLCVSISIPLIGPEWTVLSQWEDNIHILPLKVLCAIISPVTQELALHNLPHLLLTASPQCLSEFFNLTEYLLDLFSIVGHQLHFTQIPIITVIKWVDRLCSCWVDNIEHGLEQKGVAREDSVRADKLVAKYNRWLNTGRNKIWSLKFHLHHPKLFYHIISNLSPTSSVKPPAGMIHYDT